MTRLQHVYENYNIEENTAYFISSVCPKAFDIKGCTYCSGEWEDCRKCWNQKMSDNED